MKLKVRPSRRERMVYIVSAMIIAFGVFAILEQISLFEVAAFSSPILVLAGYYVKSETDRRSETKDY